MLSYRDILILVFLLLKIILYNSREINETILMDGKENVRNRLREDEI